jgi:hypothetical protein
VGQAAIPRAATARACLAAIVPAEKKLAPIGALDSRGMVRAKPRTAGGSGPANAPLDHTAAPPWPAGHDVRDHHDLAA